MWEIDIDDEADAKQGYSWSITIRHKICYVQSGLSSLDALEAMRNHLASAKSIDQLFRIGGTNEFEILIGIVEQRLHLRMARNRDLGGAVFPWLLECTFPVEEVSDLVQALGEALCEAESSGK
jgi:hypothetical protein